MLEVAKESMVGNYLTIEERAAHAQQPVKMVINDEMFCQEGELMIPARPDSEGDMRQGPSGPEFKQDDEGKDQDANEEN